MLGKDPWKHHLKTWIIFKLFKFLYFPKAYIIILSSLFIYLNQIRPVCKHQYAAIRQVYLKIFLLKYNNKNSFLKLKIKSNWINALNKWYNFNEMYRKLLLWVIDKFFYDMLENKIKNKIKNKNTEK